MQAPTAFPNPQRMFVASASRPLTAPTRDYRRSCAGAAMSGPSLPRLPALRQLNLDRTSPIGPMSAAIGRNVLARRCLAQASAPQPMSPH
jgi:hypothetical protein